MEHRAATSVRSAEDLVATSVDTVVYAGKPGATPSARIGVLSWEYPPYEGGLVYLVDGLDRDGQSTSAILQSESVRRSAERIEKKMRSSPIARLFPTTRPETSAERAASNVLQQMGPAQRTMLPESFGTTLVAEMIRTGAMTATRGTRFDGPSIDRARLDARVVPYDKYSWESISLGFSTERSPAWNSVKERAWKQTISSDTLHATHPVHGDDVLIACGAAWDVRYAAELVPGVVLREYVDSVVEALPDEEILHQDMLALFDHLPHTVAHHAAQHLVRETDLQFAYERAGIPKAEDQRAGLEEVGLQVYQQTALDRDAYFRIVDHADVRKAGIGLSQSVRALDAMRPHLRQFGIFDASAMEDHATLVREVVIKSHQGVEPDQALEQGALTLRKHITAERQADLQAKIAQSEAEMPMQERMTRLLDRVRKQHDVAPEIVIVPKDNAASRGYVDPSAPTRPSVGRER